METGRFIRKRKKDRIVGGGLYLQRLLCWQERFVSDSLVGCRPHDNSSLFHRAFALRSYRWL